MSAPTRYSLSYDFTGFQSANPNTPLPADKLEIEFTNVETSIGQTITNLGLIQRSDGALNNGIVEFDSLSNSMKALLGTPLNPRGDWVTNTVYKVLDLVTVGSTTYIAVVDHASSISFTADLAADKWLLWANPGFVDGTSYFQKFSGNGSQTAFTVSQDMGTDENSLMIFINNAGWSPIDPSTYTISGTTLTFNVAPVNGTNNIFVFAPVKLLSQAAAYAAAASTSATSAATQATNAASSASSAATSATNAANSATAAANSASTASTQATNAANSATSASNSASSASSSASTASTQATNAANSASAAATSATNAAASALSAQSAAAIAQAHVATVEINTAGVASPKSLTNSDLGKLFINTGATEKNYYTLPTPGASDLFDFKFACTDADGMRIVAPAGVTILVADVTTAPAGYADTTTIGATLWLVSVGANTYMIMSMMGVWDVT